MTFRQDGRSGRPRTGPVRNAPIDHPLPDESPYLQLLEGSGADAAAVGGKAASLDRLVAAGFPVPPALVVTTAAYRQFVDASGVAPALTRVVNSPLPAGSVAEDAHRRLEAAFLDATMPPDLAAAFSSLGGLLEGVGAVSVRSSATAEDLGSASFAGQYLSVLDVRGLRDVISAVVRVWASLWHPWARAYRRQLEVAEDDLAMGVIVQRMVPAERSGVIFTRDPVLPAALRLEVVDGLGERLVSGEATPDVHQLRRPGLWPIDGTTIDSALREAAHTALLIEERFGGQPQDVEWSVLDGRVWVLQARPITTLEYPQPDEDDGFDTAEVEGAELVATGVQEMLPGVLGPLTWTINGPMVEEAFRKLYADLGVLPADLEGPFTYIGRRQGRALLNLAAVKEASLAMAGWSPAQVERFYLGVGEHDEDDDGPGRFSWHSLVATIRGARLRAKARAEAETFEAAVRMVVEADTDMSTLLDFELQAYRWRARDLAAAGVRAEVAVAAAAVSAYAGLEGTLRRWMGDEGLRWAQLLTRDAGRGAATPVSRVAELLGARPPEVRAQLVAALEDRAAATLDEALEGAGEEGFRFLAEVRRELRRLGSAAVYAGPTWLEQPEFVRSVLARPPSVAEPPAAGSGADLIELERRLFRNWRWRLTRVLTGQVVDMRRRSLYRMIADASSLLSLRERAKSALLALGGEERRVVRELARRMAERGVLSGIEDMEMMADWELDDLLLEGAVVPEAEIERRRAVVERWAATPPAPLVEPAEPVDPAAGVSVRGWGASPGSHRGPVRVVFDPTQAGDVPPGAVLVAPATDPSWVPLFQHAGALVIERGGPLSHAAIVAREFRLPAVLNVAGATTIFRSGDLVEVDGDAGTVRVLGADGSDAAHAIPTAAADGEDAR